MALSPRLRVVLVAGALAAGCSDYGFHTKAGPSDAGDGATTSTDGGQEDSGEVAAPQEECNGQDDDGDGDIDEGFPDTDGDGVADCTDDECGASQAGPAEVPVDARCPAGGEVVVDPWAVAVEWHWPGYSGDRRFKLVSGTPVVGQLVDTDGDGRVDADDTPAIVVVAGARPGEEAMLVALDGASGSEHWAVPDIKQRQGAVLADVDGDGHTDVLAVDGAGRAVAFQGDGTLLWRSGEALSDLFLDGAQVAVADLDADGQAEVLVADLVLDGLTGGTDLSGLGPTSTRVRAWVPTAADLDLDGDQELIHGDAVYDHQGERLWQSSFTGVYGQWTTVVNADADPDGEVVMLGGGQLAVYEADGSERLRTTVGAVRSGPPCVGDFDGDGLAELAWGSEDAFQVVELDGTELWQAPIEDASGAAGCSAWDVDGDGVHEALFADQTTMHIFDGATGMVLYSDPEHASGTHIEYPSVADVDGDGAGEILFGGDDAVTEGRAGLTVLGHGGDGWGPAGRGWPTHNHAVTNILDDGTVPVRPAPWWQLHNVYRGVPTDGEPMVDLAAAFVDVCAASCEEGGRVEATVVLSNEGGADSRAGLMVSLYADDDGVLSLIDQRAHPDPVRSGTATSSLSFHFTAQQLGTHGLRVIVDDDGTASGVGVQVECDEGDNEAEWTEPVCP